MSTNTRLRFAPSPTGYLHIGSLRTLLFNYLIVKRSGGRLILRVEDTDQKREVKGAVESLLDTLAWLKIEFNEGPHVGGDYGPYVQSKRLEIYKKYADELLARGGAYYCFCSEDRLKQMREEQTAKKLPPRYDRLCRDLSAREINQKISREELFVIRQKIPLTGEIIVQDELRGQIKFQAADLEDQVLIKSNQVPTYQFASVVDDHLMAISHVLRGEEWLSSFPKNILLYQAFGWIPPKFIHLPLVLNKGGGKLSKRQGDVAVEDYRTKGYLPEALLNFVALQGWHPKDDNEILSLDEMVKKFDYKDLGSSPAVFDTEKLDYFNGYYIRQMPLEKLTKLCLPYLVNGGEISFDYMKKVMALERERLKKLSDISQAIEFFFADKLDYAPELLIWKKMSREEAKKNLKEILEALKKIPLDSWTDDSIEEAIMTHIKAKAGKVGEYLWPMRASLTGQPASPGPFQVAEVLGKEESLERIRQGVNKI